ARIRWQDCRFALTHRAVRTRLVSRFGPLESLLRSEEQSVQNQSQRQSWDANSPEWIVCRDIGVAVAALVFLNLPTAAGDPLGIKFRGAFSVESRVGIRVADPRPRG